jgi:hypothetical protein
VTFRNVKHSGWRLLSSYLPSPTYGERLVVPSQTLDQLISGWIKLIAFEDIVTLDMVGGDVDSLRKECDPLPEVLLSFEAFLPSSIIEASPGGELLRVGGEYNVDRLQAKEGCMSDCE